MTVQAKSGYGSIGKPLSTQRRAVLLSIMVCLVACGSGGGGGGSSPPTISGLSFSPTGAYVASSGGSVTVSGSFSFAGANSGVASVTITILDASGMKVGGTTTQVPNGGGLTSGVIQGSVVASTATAGTFTVNATLIDLSGMVSNSLSGTFSVKPFPWVAQAGMPTPRIHAAVVAVGSRFYVMGGEPTVSNVIPAPTLTTVEIFDAVTSTWTTGVPMPVAREYVSAINVGGRIYAFGGSAGVPPSACYVRPNAAVFDPGTNAWTTLTSAPIMMSGTAIAAIGTSIYLIGGVTDCPGTAASSTVQVYDTGLDRWSASASLPGVAEQLSAAVQNGKIVEFGGLLNLTGGSGNATVSQSIYDPSMNAWTVTANGFVMDGVELVADIASAVVNGSLYATGGDTSIGTLELGLWLYNPATSAWVIKESLPGTLPNSTTSSYVVGPMADSYNGQLYAFSSNATWVYTLANDLH